MNGSGAALAAHRAVEGCYEAARAAALSGVPISTVYYWANREVVTPSVSPVRTRLRSYGDLMALRIVSWLRRPKNVDDGLLPASPMPEVRRVLSLLDKLGSTCGDRTATVSNGHRSWWTELATPSSGPVTTFWTAQDG